MTRCPGSVQRARIDLTTPAQWQAMVPQFGTTILLRGEDVPAEMAAIASALPCRWQADISLGSGGEWLHPRPGGTSGGSTIGPGAHVNIGGSAAGACIQAGGTTVRIWQPWETITALLGDRPVEETQ